MIQGTPINIIVGSHVWAEDPEFAWIDGEVTEIKGTDATIVTSNGKTVSQSHVPILSFFQLDENFNIKLISIHILITLNIHKPIFTFFLKLL